MAPSVSNDPEYIKLMEFLIEKTKNAKTSMSLKQLAEEFKETSGSSQQIKCLVGRIGIFRSKLQRMNSIDKVAKVRMLVALGVSIDKDFLDELRTDAHVEVDDDKRITKYKANDGSFEMEGDHSVSAKRKLGWDRQKQSPKFSGSTSPEIQLLRQPKLEEDPEASGSPGSAGASPHQEAPIFRSWGAPRASEALLRPKSEANRASNTPGSNDTPVIKFLEAIQSLISPLGIPSLSELQTKIEQKLRESSNEKIPKNEMIPAMELLVAKIANHSVANLSESVESVNLFQLLCYLKAAIVNSKLEGLERLLEKIEEGIKEPTSKFKSIPVEEVASVLQTTLDNIGF